MNTRPLDHQLKCKLSWLEVEAGGRSTGSNLHVRHEAYDRLSMLDL